MQTFALPLGYGTDKNGAVDEARTRDLHLGKVALYQLSYYRIWCGRRDLNSYAMRHQILSLARLPFRHARMNKLVRGRWEMTHWRFELQTP